MLLESVTASVFRKTAKNCRFGIAGTISTCVVTTHITRAIPTMGAGALKTGLRASNSLLVMSVSAQHQTIRLIGLTTMLTTNRAI